jgi:hypothetical protein
MAFEEQIENLKDQLKNTWGTVKESESYSSIKEKYDDLTPAAQKGLQVAGVLLFCFFLFSMISGLFSDSTMFIDDFENRKATIRELLKLKRDITSVPPVPTPPPAESLKAQIESKLSESGVGKDQITQIATGPATDDGSNMVPKSVRQESVVVDLATLNLRQVVSIGRTMQSLHPFVKLMGVEVNATPKDNHYFNAKYTIVGFYAPEVKAEEPEGKPGAPKKPTFNRRRPIRNQAPTESGG